MSHQLVPFTFISRQDLSRPSSELWLALEQFRRLVHSLEKMLTSINPSEVMPDKLYPSYIHIYVIGLKGSEPTPGVLGGFKRRALSLESVLSP